MSSTHAGLKVDGLTRRLGGRDVVKDVSLSVEPGRVTCLLGPSGCGKSTTLRLIAGVDCQDKGTVSLGGRVVSDGVIHEPPEARHVGLMFQDFALFPHLSVAENVAFGLTGSKREKESRVKSLLERVHLEDFIGAHPHELSGGEQQRVALARAIAPKPAIMLMDEPFSGLDNRLRDDIRDETLDILKEDGTAVLLVTHEPDEAMRMADEIALMRRGEIVQRGAPYNIYNAPVDKEAAAFFSDINVIPGVVKGALDYYGRARAIHLKDADAPEISHRIAMSRTSGSISTVRAGVRCPRPRTAPRPWRACCAPVSWGGKALSSLKWTMTARS